MRVQLNTFEDNGMAVLLLYPHGKESFDVPGDVFEVGVARDWRETGQMAAENESLLNELLGRDG
jgi:hypothetical protein